MAVQAATEATGWRLPIDGLSVFRSGLVVRGGGASNGGTAGANGSGSGSTANRGGGVRATQTAALAVPVSSL
jgi:hypothetical protein